jgi:fucose permease
VNANDLPVASHLLRRARVAVTLTFFLNGVLFSSWVSRIPQVQNNLSLSEGQLGLALLALALGALLSLLAAGWLVVRFGSKPVTTVGLLSLSLPLPLPALAQSWLQLAIALFILGVAAGALDIAMNSQGVLIQRHTGRPILSSMHAAFSLGGFGGAVAGGLVASAGVTPGWHFAGVGLASAALALMLNRRMLDAGQDAQRGGSSFVRPSRAIAALGIVAFCGLLVEGAVADWSAVYLNNVLETGPGLAAGGFAAFSLAMAAGRITGDRLVYLTSPTAVVRYGGLIAAAGMSLALVSGNPWLTLLGFALVGAGMANVVPIIFSAAGQMPGLAPGPAIAAVASSGYFGFLAGPPIIGLVAELITLRAALVTLVILSATIGLLAGSVRR